MKSFCSVGIAHGNKKTKLLCRGQANRAITNPETETKDKGRDTKMKKKKKNTRENSK